VRQGDVRCSDQQFSLASHCITFLGKHPQRSRGCTSQDNETSGKNIELSQLAVPGTKDVGQQT